MAITPGSPLNPQYQTYENVRWDVPKTGLLASESNSYAILILLGIGVVATVLLLKT